MVIEKHAYDELKSRIESAGAKLVAVSKTKAATDILDLYAYGQRDFGENYVQELVQKAAELPTDIRWHFIGHLQTNKVKSIIPFVQLIHGVDSLKLLTEISKQAAKANKVVNVLLQVHIAKEETKFGLNEEELANVMAAVPSMSNIKLCGLMGMSSLTENILQVRREFQLLHSLFEKYKSSTPENWNTLSMGMSGDYLIALEEGSTLVRIGSLLFGERTRQ